MMKRVSGGVGDSSQQLRQLKDNHARDKLKVISFKGKQWDLRRNFVGVDMYDEEAGDLIEPSDPSHESCLEDSDKEEAGENSFDSQSEGSRGHAINSC